MCSISKLQNLNIQDIQDLHMGQKVKELLIGGEVTRKGHMVHGNMWRHWREQQEKDKSSRNIRARDTSLGN